MRKALLMGVIIAIAVSMAVAQEPPQTPVTISLSEAIALAAANNPGLAIARERVDRARNVVREARGQGRFRVDADASYSRTGPSSEFTIPGPDGEPVTIDTGADSQLQASAIVAQPIDISRRFSLLRQVAGLQLDIQGFAEVQTLRDLINNVQSAYYGVLRAEGGVDVAQSAVDVAEEQLRIARARFEAGVVPRFDVLQAEVNLRNLEQNLIQARSQVSVARGVLNSTIGFDANRPIDVQPVAVPVEPVTVDIPARTIQALERRPEVTQARLGVDLAERNVRLTETEDDPALAVFARTNWQNETSAFQPNQTTYTIGANINWPIWTGGVTQARVAQARNDVDIARGNLDQATLGVTLDVKTAAENVMEASRRAETAQANVELAVEALRLARLRYQEGLATFVEVTEAESQLTQAQTNAVNAAYDYLTALADLERATATQPDYERLVVSPTPALGAPATPAVPDGVAPAVPIEPAEPAVPDVTSPQGEVIGK